jgi:hypothetical protein
MSWEKLFKCSNPDCDWWGVLDEAKYVETHPARAIFTAPNAGMKLSKLKLAHPAAMWSMPTTSRAVNACPAVLPPR